MNYSEQKFKDRLREAIVDGMIQTNTILKHRGNPAMVAEFIEQNQKEINDLVEKHHEVVLKHGFAVALDRVKELYVAQERKVDFK